MRTLRWQLAAGALAVLSGCSGGPAGPAAGPSPMPGPAVTAPGLAMTQPSTRDPTVTEPSTPSPTASRPGPRATPAPPPAFDVGRALRTVRRLARLGPREATSPAYRRAATLVQRRLRALGYDVRRQPLRVPAGTSWGIAVPAGRTVNVLGHPPGFDPGAPYLVVGAHLDTVPQSPGAVDDASGIAVVLEVARLAAARPTAVPVVVAAFGAEEPRGPGDDLHHFGSRAYVAALGARARAALVGAVSVDSVGIARRVPVCTGGRGPARLAAAVLARARALRIPARRCDNRTGDHWSFERAGLAAVRIGEAGLDAYAEYHSARDRPAVLDPADLARAGRLTWEAARTLR